jgi:hypothetical protein
MNLRWLWFDYCDPELPLSLGKRLRIAFRPFPIWSMPTRIWIGRVWFFLGLLPVMLLQPIGFWIVGKQASPKMILSLGLVFLAGWPVFWVWSCAVYALTCRREHRHRIRLEGFDICIECGYWLRGLGDDVKECPECGAKREAMPVNTVAANPPAEPGAKGF